MSFILYPEELSRGMVTLSCESSVDGDSDDKEACVDSGDGNDKKVPYATAWQGRTRCE
ncbi:Hypothetical predicted protein [Olea europaea subsp. europaea]|uniref:Uncharacterized protein n=1 Tax=Olea europaea subsp. europaea TaxID=158383 RepID=A0A8S0T6I8_OLEEU|nr:Hypothetical predicted protein [Olea europaea subsp. europaea]